MSQESLISLKSLEMQLLKETEVYYPASLPSQKLFIKNTQDLRVLHGGVVISDLLSMISVL